MLPPVAKVK